MKVEKNNIPLVSLLFFLFGCLIVTKGLSSSRSVSNEIDIRFDRSHGIGNFLDKNIPEYK